MKRKRIFWIAIVGLLLATSCTTIDVYEKQQQFGSHQWKAKVPLSFNFDIKDTTRPYNIYFVLRHTDAYKYQNIWIRARLQHEKDSMLTQMLNVQLADGSKWLGTGMDDVFDVRGLLNASPIYLKPGKYLMSLEHVMRDNPLPEILAAGLRVEKQR